MNKSNGLKPALQRSEQLNAEILAILFKDTSKSFVIAICVALTLIVALSDETSTTEASIWFILFFAAYSLRTIIVNQQRKHQFKFDNAGVWLNRFRLSTLLCGLAWGASGLLLFPEISISHQAMLAFAVGGVSAGGLINYSTDKLSSLAFAGGALLPLGPAYINSANTLSKIIFFLSCVFVIYVAVACKKLASGILSNITLRIEAENQQKQIAMMSEKQNFHLAHTPLGLIDWDANLTITAWNKACTDMLGYTAEEAIGMHISFIMPEMINKPSSHILHAITNADNKDAEFKDIYHKNGNKVYCEWFNTLLKNETGEIVGIASLIQDKTEFIASQETIRQLAYFDSLTGLPNRSLLLDRMNQSLTAAQGDSSYSMLAFIDLDHFKTINDVRGHDAGDYLLKTIANRLQNNMRSQDTAARLGGDEFVLVLPNIGSSRQQAKVNGEKVIKKIMQVINEPVVFDDYQHQCSASVGLCLFKDDSADATELLRRADIAMYLSKQQGRNAYQHYDDVKLPEYEYKLKLKHELNRALANNQLQLHLQGQYNRNLEVTGAEMLLRWQHPELGMVMPSDFIPLAEETGAIIPIGYWVIKQACDLLKTWQSNPSSNDLRISVNVSAVQFNHVDFVKEVGQALQESGCDATKLCLELTESSVIMHIEESIKKMHLIKAMGVSLSIDDFGTGYSSLSALKNLPLNELKIDRAFVKDFTKNPIDLTIVQTILQMGKNLNLRIVAEGVETESQMAYLSNYGCNLFQGYFFAKPCSIYEFDSQLALLNTKVSNNIKPAKKALLQTKPSQYAKKSVQYDTADVANTVWPKPSNTRH